MLTVVHMVKPSKDKVYSNPCIYTYKSKENNFQVSSSSFTNQCCSVNTAKVLNKTLSLQYIAKSYTP